jgi:branched-chain amino acid transport system ATP-binding protein
LSGPILEATGLTKRFGAVVAADDLDLAVEAGETHAVIGPNGAGKTTLIGQLTGLVRPDAGRIRLAGIDVTDTEPHVRARHGLARSFQITSVFEALTVLENVVLAVQAVSGHSFRFFAPALGERRLRETALAALGRVGLEQRAADPAHALSHGEKRQLELAMAVAPDPRLLLLDEPLAGQGPGEGEAIVALLADLGRAHAILLVEHDMDAVFQLADRITVLDGGRVIASGAPAAVRGDHRVREAYLGDADG